MLMLVRYKSFIDDTALRPAVSMGGYAWVSAHAPFQLMVPKIYKRVCVLSYAFMQISSECDLSFQLFLFFHVRHWFQVNHVVSKILIGASIVVLYH